VSTLLPFLASVVRIAMGAINTITTIPMNISIIVTFPPIICSRLPIGITIADDPKMRTK
jgi:hypothetical protein